MALGYCLSLGLLEADQLEQASPGQTVRDRVPALLRAVSRSGNLRKSWVRGPGPRVTQAMKCPGGCHG